MYGAFEQLIEYHHSTLLSSLQHGHRSHSSRRNARIGDMGEPGAGTMSLNLAMTMSKYIAAAIKPDPVADEIGEQSK
jgi:hypothetical protein